MKNRYGSLKKEGAIAGFEAVFKEDSDSNFLQMDSRSSADQVFSIIRARGIIRERIPRSGLP
jgi:hypothetical protein